FLDDDAVASTGLTEQVAAAFAADERLGGVSFRLVDEDEHSEAILVPRPGGRDADRSGDVAVFLGGASAIRRSAYEEAGGFFGDLFYGHEETELSWRLIDAGWSIRYLAEATVFHPRIEIGRHPERWRMTGRNRVLVARRALPWPIAIVHVSVWLVLGAIRAGRQRCLRGYVAGWMAGWRRPVDRSPISWRGVWRLTRLGRPPVL
ncbi:MAG: glycosyltransferase family 2 protein, partial [Actinomycetota bacterium]